MKIRKISERVSYVGAVDWDRRLFDALVPLPHGTSYNAYLVRGDDKCVLLDTVDPTMIDIFSAYLDQIPKIDYLISHHSEQDHSGLIPEVLRRYPACRVLTSAPGKKILQDLLHLSPDVIDVVKEGDTLALGGLTMKFVSTPWVHWPETFCTWLEEEQILFSCDFFASHLAASDLYAEGDGRVLEAAKRYYSEIMMPYANIVRKNVEKVAVLKPRLIAPSHGPLYRNPDEIMETWRRWTDPKPGEEVIIVFVSMHGSTRMLVDRLCSELSDKGIRHQRFDLTTADTGQIAMSLLDAQTLVLGTPLVLNGAHPLVLHAASLINALQPKIRRAVALASYGWNAKPLEQAATWMPDMKIEWIPALACRGCPRAGDFAAVDALAQTIAEKHAAATAPA